MLATVEKIVEIFPHPNADKLEFVKVLGYNCLTQKGVYKLGDKVILIQPDTVLPVAEWSEIYRKHSKNRVKAIRLRGEWSFGIVESLKLLPDPLNGEYEIGEEVSEFLGIVKYEPPAPKDLQAKGLLPFGLPKTDEERWQNLDLSPWLGQLVDVTLKVDGQSFTCYYNNQFGVTGRSLELKLDAENNYTRQVHRYNLEEKLTKYCQKYGVNIALRGESYGPGIQGYAVNPHSKGQHGLYFFSVWDFDQKRYLYKNSKDEHNYVKICTELDLPMVPVLEYNVPLTMELIKKYSDDLEKLNGEFFEGVVIKGDGFSFKVINKYYDSLK